MYTLEVEGKALHKPSKELMNQIEQQAKVEIHLDTIIHNIKFRYGLNDKVTFTRLELGVIVEYQLYKGMILEEDVDGMVRLLKGIREAYTEDDTFLSKVETKVKKEIYKHYLMMLFNQKIRESIEKRGRVFIPGIDREFKRVVDSDYFSTYQILGRDAYENLINTTVQKVYEDISLIQGDTLIDRYRNAYGRRRAYGRVSKELKKRNRIEG